MSSSNIEEKMADELRQHEHALLPSTLQHCSLQKNSELWRLWPLTEKDRQTDRQNRNIHKLTERNRDTHVFIDLGSYVKLTDHTRYQTEHGCASSKQLDSCRSRTTHERKLQNISSFVTRRGRREHALHQHQREEALALDSSCGLPRLFSVCPTPLGRQQRRQQHK